MNSQIWSFEFKCFHRAIQINRKCVLTQNHSDLSTAPAFTVKCLNIIHHLKLLFSVISGWLRADFVCCYSNSLLVRKQCYCHLLYPITQICSKYISRIPDSTSSVIASCNLNICPVFKESRKWWRCTCLRMLCFFNNSWNYSEETREEGVLCTACVSSCNKIKEVVMNEFLRFKV